MIYTMIVLPQREQHIICTLSDKIICTLAKTFHEYIMYIIENI